MKSMARLRNDVTYLGRVDQWDSGAEVWEPTGFRSKTRAALHAAHTPANAAELYDAYRKGRDVGYADRHPAVKPDDGLCATRAWPAGGRRKVRARPAVSRVQDAAMRKADNERLRRAAAGRDNSPYTF